MTEPLLTLPISKIEILEHSPGELHIVVIVCHIFALYQHCIVEKTFYQSLDAHLFTLVIRERDRLGLVVRIPIEQEEVDQLSELLAKLQAESASYD